ncbi:MOSC domain-containing protein [Mucilaginibacter robiniae]|uniref:MOSC domain-containing protein n=1 Tax=Mucilaginibacter robiniae TaxID=2728022 RepID=A0A7L5DZ34_9SPHI|nr:MOSC N-terminal beta barrel domain-containing protein [Mucilaginibacter robiniae]QJD94544.1 MOSC domain-containing protein [Mucilaginibacter robiniae]
MFQISQLYIYPVKSLGGISVTEAQVTSRGLQHDRRWMLVDEHNQFLSQRTLPQLALFKLNFVVNGLQVTYADDCSIVIPFQPTTTEYIEVTIWNDQCKAQLVSTAISKWFTGKLGYTCKLVYMPDETHRGIDLRYASPDDITSFADEYQLLLISQNSLDDLNSRLNEAVPMNRFRPNMVITALEPYWEDQLEHFTIGSISFYGVKLCARCTMIGVNQQNAIAGVEPLKILSTYRKRNNKIYFGQNLLHAGEGIIQVGQEIKVVSLKQVASFASV